MVHTEDVPRTSEDTKEVTTVTSTVGGSPAVRNVEISTEPIIQKRLQEAFCQPNFEMKQQQVLQQQQQEGVRKWLEEQRLLAESKYAGPALSQSENLQNPQEQPGAIDQRPL
jgi:hypothetical protein